MDCDCNRMDCSNCYQYQEYGGQTLMNYYLIQNLKPSNRAVKINLVYFSLTSIRIVTNINGEIPISRKPYVILKFILFLSKFYIFINKI